MADNPRSERFAELAEAYVAEGRWEEAVQVCETGLGYHPEQPAGHLVYAKALVGLDQLEQGIQSFERACALRSADVGIYSEVGHFLVDRGHVQAGIPYLQNAIRIDPHDPRVIHLKERVEAELGEEFERIETGRWQRDEIGTGSGQGWGELGPEVNQPAGLDEEEDEPPTVYDVNPLARQLAARDVEPDELRQAQETLYDEGAGLRAEVAQAVDRLGDESAGEPPTRDDLDAEDREIARPNRDEPPTMFGPEQRLPDPWDVASGVGPAPRQEPPTLFEEGPDEGLGSGPRVDSTRVSASRPRGPLFPEPEPQTAPTTAISYWKVFLVVVPFLLAAIAGGLYFGFRHLRNEKVSSLLEQTLGSVSQDTFAGYSDAQLTLRKLLELEDAHRRGRSLLALVTARLHDEYGPNLSLRDESQKLIADLAADEETGVDLLWARQHLAEDSSDPSLAADLAQTQRQHPQNPRLMALAGERSLQQGNRTEARQWLEASLREDPSNPRTLATLSEVEIDQGEPRQASEHLVKALAANTAHVRSLLALARLRVFQQADLDRASEDLEKVLKLPQVTDSRRSQAHLVYADLSFIRSERSRALAAVKAASDLVPEDAGFQQALAELCLKYNELDEAAARGKRVAELQPEDMTAKLFLIETDLARGQSKQALESLNGLLGKRVPANPFFLLRARALHAQGNHAATLADLNHIPQDARERPEAWALEVRAQLALGDIERARREASALQSQHPDLPISHLTMGRYRLVKDLRRSATAAFAKAVQLDPRCHAGWVLLAELDHQAHKHAEAESNLARALEANPFDLEAYLLLGRVKLASGAPKTALDNFARVVLEKPDFGPALVGMAEALLDLGDLDKSLKAIRKARKAGAEDAHARHVEGRVYLANGRFHTAIRALTQADELQPKNPEILADLGMALLSVRSLSKAEQTFEESLRRSPRRQRLPRAQEGLARILVIKRKWTDAARAYERAALYAKSGDQADPEVSRLYLEAGRVLLKDTRAGESRYGRARRSFRLAAQASPTDAEPLYEVAATYDRAEQLKPARQAYQEVLQVAADHPMTLYRLGLLEFDDGKDERAKELLTRFLETKPSGKLARMAQKVLNKIK